MKSEFLKTVIFDCFFEAKNNKKTTFTNKKKKINTEIFISFVFLFLAMFRRAEAHAK